MSRRIWLKAATAATFSLGLSKTATCSSFPSWSLDIAGNVETHQVRLLHQILIVDGFTLPVTLPEDISRRIAALAKLYPTARHKLWSGEEIRSFIVKHFDREVQYTFDSLKAYACKCDLARLCLLYVHGGIYSDIMLEHYTTWKIPVGYGFAAFRQPWVFRPYTASVSNSLIWSNPGREELQIAIQTIVEHCRTRFYGIDKIEPTACWPLGRACAAAAADRWREGKDDDQYMGVHLAKSLKDDMIFHTPQPCSEPIGCRSARPAGDWAATGLAGTNNYAAMWAARDLYQ